ncbi:MAG: hypothetical protein IT326_06985 [Anaerolineae bacterium]|nr:hypothetical protein [Anaerolineae bacterium]
MAVYGAADLIQQAEAHGSVRLIRRVLEGRDPANVRALASKAIETPGLVVLLGVPGAPAHVIVARSGDVPGDMPTVLRTVLAALGSEKGGGRPDFAQGTAPETTVEALEAALLVAESAVLQA